MKKDLERVFATVTISSHDLLTIPKEDYATFIKDSLSKELANQIIENMDNLPVIQESERVSDTYSEGGIKYTVIVNLISNEELRRLRKIEFEYKTLMHNKENTSERSVYYDL